MSMPLRLQRFLTKAGSDFRVRLRETEQLPGRRSGSTTDLQGCIARAVPVQDTKGCALAVIPDDRRLDLDALNAEFGRRFRIAGPELARRLCPDCLPDALPPVGAAYGIETFLDEELTKRDEVLLEAGDGTRLLHVWGEDFQELFYGAWCGRFSARRRPRKRGPAPQPRALRHRSHHANSGGPTSAGVSSGIKTTGAAN